MKDFLKWAFNDRKHRNRIIFCTLLTVIFFVMVLNDPASGFWNLIFLSIVGIFYVLNWLMLYKIYNKNK